MEIEVATSLTGSAYKNINFTDTIGHRRQVPKEGKRDDDNCFWLSREWTDHSENTRATKVIPLFIVRASKAGCNTFSHWEKRYNKITFKCLRGRCNNEHSNRVDSAKRRPNIQLKKPHDQPIKRNRKSQRPTKLSEEQIDDPMLQEEMEESDLIKCKFMFSVFWDNLHSRWFIPKEQSGCKHHTGHPHIDHPQIRLQSRHALTVEEIGVAESAVASDITPRQTATMVQNRTGVSLERRQLEYISRRQDRAAFLANGNSSPADKLSAYFLQTGVSHVALYADYDSQLLTIKQKTRSSNSRETNVTTFDDDLGDITETPEMFASSLKGAMRDNLTDSTTGQLLLLSMWTTDTARRKFDMHPEFVSVDDTEGTNSEERPLHDWCAKDGYNKLFPVLWAYLPSKAQWAYTFVCRGAAVLFPGTALQRVVKINSDADKQESRAIHNAIGGSRKRYAVESNNNRATGEVALPLYKKRTPHLSSLISVFTSSSSQSILPNAQHGWCGFHKVNRNFTHHVQYKSILDAAKDKDIFGRLEIDIIVRWMWYFIKYYKTMEEVEMSADMYNFYMTEEDQSEHIAALEAATRSKILEFMCKSFFVHSDMLFESCFDGMTMEEVTTSINEAWHRATKRVAGGPGPSHDVGTAAKRIHNLTEQNEQGKAKEAAFHVTSAPAKGDDRKCYVRSLTNHCNKKLFKEWKKSKYYEIFRCSENEWYVKRNYDLYPTTVDDDLGKALEYCMKMLKIMCTKIEEAEYQVERKTISELKEKLLGIGKGNLPQYRKIANSAMMYVIPRFERTHIVRIETMANGENVLSCDNDKHSPSCRYCKHGQACTHLYRLLDRPANINDAHVRWHTGYSHFYGKDDVMTKHYINLRDNLQHPGVVLTDSECRYIRNNIAIGEGTMPESFFTRSLRKLYLSGKDTYWHKIRHRLPAHIQECIPLPSISENNNELGDENMDHMSTSVDFNSNGDNATAVQPLTGQIGGNSVFHQGSDYMVPSQLTQTEPERVTLPVNTRQTETDARSKAETLPVPAQGKDLKSDFMPIYETLCKFTQSAGEEGRLALEHDLNFLREKQIELMAKKQARNSESTDVYSEYMHIYQNVCRLANETGTEGRLLLRDSLNNMKKGKQIS